MAAINQTSARACEEILERFFGSHPDQAAQVRSLKALHFLAACEEPLLGKAEGWAAGIVYYVVTRDRPACGVPGLLNSEFSACFGVSMETIRKRAAHVGRLLAL